MDQAATKPTMASPVFGDLEYDLDWRGLYECRLFEVAFPVTLVVPCDERGEIHPAQIDAFLGFEAIKDRTPDLVAQAVFDYYLGIVDERREMAGPAFADEIAPRVQAPHQMAALIKPTELIVLGTYRSDERVVGLLFDCRWDSSQGLAVKFVNENLAEIGPQDIVL